MRRRGWHGRRASGARGALEKLGALRNAGIREVSALSLDGVPDWIEVGSGLMDGDRRVAMVASQRPGEDLIGWARVAIALAEPDVFPGEVVIAAPVHSAIARALAADMGSCGIRISLMAATGLADPADELAEVDSLPAGALLLDSLSSVYDRVVCVLQGAAAITSCGGLRPTSVGHALYLRGLLAARVRREGDGVAVSIVVPDKRRVFVNSGNFPRWGVDLHEIVVQLAQDPRLANGRAEEAADESAAQTGVRVVARWIPCSPEGTLFADWVGIDGQGRARVGIARERVRLVDAVAAATAMHVVGADRALWAPGSQGGVQIDVSAAQIDPLAQRVLDSLAIRAMPAPPERAEIREVERVAHAPLPASSDDAPAALRADEREGDAPEDARERRGRRRGRRRRRGRGGERLPGETDAGEGRGPDGEAAVADFAAEVDEALEFEGEGDEAAESLLEAGEDAPFSEGEPEADRIHEAIAGDDAEAGATESDEEADSERAAESEPPPEPEAEPEEQPRALPRRRRQRATVVVRNDPDAILAGLVLARDRRSTTSFRVLRQEDLIDYLKGPANDVSDADDLLLVGFTAHPHTRETLQIAELFRGRLQWFDHHFWPIEDLEMLRNALGSESVLVEEAANPLPLVDEVTERRSRFTDKLIDLSARRLSENDMSRWGYRMVGLIQRMAESPAEYRSSIGPVLAGKPAELPLPEGVFAGEARWVEENDPRLVCFGEYELAVCEVPGDLDAGEIGRRVRAATGARLSLCTRSGDDLVLLGANEEKRPLNVTSLVDQLGTAHPWARARSSADRVGRLWIEEREAHPERLDTLIGEIVRRRSVLHG